MFVAVNKTQFPSTSKMASQPVEHKADEARTISPKVQGSNAGIANMLPPILPALTHNKSSIGPNDPLTLPPLHTIVPVTHALSRPLPVPQPYVFPEQIVLQLQEDILVYQILVPTDRLLQISAPRLREILLANRTHVIGVDGATKETLGLIDKFFKQNTFHNEYVASMNPEELQAWIKQLADINFVAIRIHCLGIKDALVPELTRTLQIATRKFPNVAFPTCRTIDYVYEMTTSLSKFRTVVTDVWAWHLPWDVVRSPGLQRQLNAMCREFRQEFDVVISRRAMGYTRCACIACCTQVVPKA